MSLTMKSSKTIFILVYAFFLVLLLRNAASSTSKPTPQTFESTNLFLSHANQVWRRNRTNNYDLFRCKNPPCRFRKFPLLRNFTSIRRTDSWMLRPKKQNGDFDFLHNSLPSKRTQTARSTVPSGKKNNFYSSMSDVKSAIVFGCKFDAECMAAISGNVFCFDGRCECRYGNKMDLKNGRCVLAVSLGDVCQYSFQCFDKSWKCLNGKCVSPAKLQNTEKFAMGFGIAVVGLLIAVSVCGCANNRRRNYSRSSTRSSRTDSRLSGGAGTSSTIQLLAELNDVPPDYSEVYLIGPQSRIARDDKPPSYEDAMREAMRQTALLVPPDQGANPPQVSPSSGETNLRINLMDADNLSDANNSEARALSPSGEHLSNAHRDVSDESAENSPNPTQNHAGRDDIMIV